MTVDDLELLLAWRSHPDVYQGFVAQNGPLQWEDHYEWWESREHRRDWIVQVDSTGVWRDIGNVNISALDADYPEVGVLIGEVTAQGSGLATRAVAFATGWLREHDYRGARAEILPDNEASQHVFEKVGFECIGSTAGVSEYEIEFV